MSLSPERAAVLSALATERSVRAVCGTPGLTDFELCQTLWAFRVIGLTRRTDVSDPVVARDPDEEGLGFIVPEA